MREVTANARTLRAYEERAARYCEDTGYVRSAAQDTLLTIVAERSPEGVVLEIGSAHGRDAATLESMGRTVRRTDATRAFVEMMRADGHRADVLDVLRDPLVDDEFPSYAAVLANAVFLHFPTSALHDVFGRVRDALAPAGLLAFTVKVGEGSEWSDHKLGLPRYFHYWQPESLTAAVERAGLDVVLLTVDRGIPWDWISVVATPATHQGTELRIHDTKDPP